MTTSRGYRYVPVYPVIGPGALWSVRTSPEWEKYPDPSMMRFWCFSGRVALYHGLRMLAVPPGSAVLFPEYFQGTEMETLRHYGVHLVFYRVRDDLTIDLDHLETVCPAGCAALYVIHYFGHAHRMEPLVAFCRERRMRLIEDCAVAMFGRYAGRWLGSCGDLAIYSPYKSIGLPHGGIGAVRATGSTPPRLEKPPLLSTVLQVRDKLGRFLKSRAPRPVERGFASLSAAARGLLKVDRTGQVASGSAAWSPSTLGLDASRWTRRMACGVSMEAAIRRRRENFHYLVEHLPPGVQLLWRSLADDECPLFLALLVDDRARVQRELIARGVESVAVWSDEQYDHLAPASAAVRRLRRSLLELPVHQDLDRRDLEHIAGALHEVFAP